MNTHTLAAGIVGFLLGGLVVSIAAEFEDGDDPAPSHGSAGIHQSVTPWRAATEPTGRSAPVPYNGPVSVRLAVPPPH